ncbi:MAG TPA: hypothetical protein VK453_12475 [Micromonosporaceae bacterium]|nr:hypothetical protein [Micromonosporaceae bacterium]
MKSIARTLLVGALTGFVAVTTPGAALAADEPPSIVETYEYPGAAHWETARPGLKLKSGDGHILIVECPSAGNPTLDLFVVESRMYPLPKGFFCFKLTGTKGYLSLEIPDAYYLRGDNTHTVSATLSIAEDPPVVEPQTVEPGQWTEIGSSAFRGKTTVMELRILS